MDYNTNGQMKVLMIVLVIDPCPSEMKINNGLRISKKGREIFKRYFV